MANNQTKKNSNEGKKIVFGSLSESFKNNPIGTIAFFILCFSFCIAAVLLTFPVLENVSTALTLFLIVLAIDVIAFPMAIYGLVKKPNGLSVIALVIRVIQVIMIFYAIYPLLSALLLMWFMKMMTGQ